MSSRGLARKAAAERYLTDSPLSIGEVAYSARLFGAGGFHQSIQAMERRNTSGVPPASAKRAAPDDPVGRLWICLNASRHGCPRQAARTTRVAHDIVPPKAGEPKWCLIGHPFASQSFFSAVARLPRAARSRGRDDCYSDPQERRAICRESEQPRRRLWGANRRHSRIRRAGRPPAVARNR